LKGSLSCALAPAPPRRSAQLLTSLR
jgi:hypothetical protein